MHKLLEEGTVVPKYLSLGHYDEDVYLNVWENHLCLILGFKKYARNLPVNFVIKCLIQDLIGRGIRKCAWV